MVLSKNVNYTANVYRQMTDELIFKSVTYFYTEIAVFLDTSVLF